MQVDLSMDQLEAVVATAEQGSFAAAARQIGKSPSVVSSHISSLERILGLARFDGSTRSICSVHAIARRYSRTRLGTGELRRLLGIDLNVLRLRFVEKDEYQGVAGLGHCIAALAGYLSGHAACIFRNHFAEAIALDGNLLTRFDLVVEFDQMLD
jgi:DNA-binding transcriptional ArsR family regulator